MQHTLIACKGEAFPGSAFDDPIYRIPALTVTSTGRIIIAYDVRSDWRDLPADFDIAMRFSDDAGRTWSQAQVLRSHTSGHGFGDASLMSDPATGTVFCWYVGSTGRSYFSAEAGGEGLELWLATSVDNGKTWTHRDMSHLRPSGVAGMFTSSGNGAVDEDGVLFQTFVARIDEENYAVCARSEDHGSTWHMGEPVGPGCDENKVVALPDGALLLQIRARPQRYQAISWDKGRSFTAPKPALPLIDPSCNGGVIRMGNILVASMCDDPRYRRRLSLHISYDDGKSWGPGILVDKGAAAYSVMCVINDNTFGLAWEADDYESIVFASITLEEIGVTASACTGEKKVPEGNYDSGQEAYTAVNSVEGDSSENLHNRVTLVPRNGKGDYAKPPVVNGD